MKTLKEIEENIISSFDSETQEKIAKVIEIEHIFNMIEKGHDAMTFGVCPHCFIFLESRMFDIDGTNLEEIEACPKCNYGAPTLS